MFTITPGDDVAAPALYGSRFWKVKRMNPFGDRLVNISEERLRSRLKAEVGKSATSTVLVRRKKPYSIFNFIVRCQSPSLRRP